jgi:hypothetical protein
MGTHGTRASERSPSRILHYVSHIHPLHPCTNNFNSFHLVNAAITGEVRTRTLRGNQAGASLSKSASLTHTTLKYSWPCSIISEGLNEWSYVLVSAAERATKELQASWICLFTVLPCTSRIPPCPIGRL